MAKLVAYIAWITATVATVSSLYASEVLRLVPCVLCWYQRILMYPLVVIIAVGAWKKDKVLPYYVLPLSMSGAVIALYHYLLQRGIIPDLVPCTLGISCTTGYVEWLGFVTIPFLSLVSFVVITACMIYLLKRKEK